MWSKAAIAGAAYFAGVFAVGFGLGTVRVLLLAPMLGETLAVVLEIPVMLAASWVICGLVLRAIWVPAQAGRRAFMGGCAFALLMSAEFALARSVFGLGVGDYLTSFQTPVGALGLFGQVAFAIFPMLQRRARR